MVHPAGPAGAVDDSGADDCSAGAEEVGWAADDNDAGVLDAEALSPDEDPQPARHRAAATTRMRRMGRVGFSTWLVSRCLGGRRVSTRTLGTS